MKNQKKGHYYDTVGGLLRVNFIEHLPPLWSGASRLKVRVMETRWGWKKGEEIEILGYLYVEKTKTSTTHIMVRRVAA